MIDVTKEQVARWRAMEARLEAVADTLFGIASLDFSRRVALAGDDSVIDAVAGCVNMLGEELAAYAAQRARVERDLEERVRARTDELISANERLLQAGKMAAVGQLAAGVAHEINNPLAVILGFAQGLERRMAIVGEQFRLPVTSILREAVRCKDLVQELLVFSRTGSRDVEQVDLAELFEATRRLLETRARSQGTAVSMDLAAGMTPITANRTQLEQVLINMGNNSLDALERGGSVTLRTRRATDRIILEVEDSGPGITADVQPRIFEPFFTTKAAGKGTGLGLSLAYEIVRQHGGHIDVISAPGQGTIMTVSLPVGPRLAPEASS